MEKILLSNDEELDIYGISNTGNVLALQFQNGNIVELEETFSNQKKLKKIALQNADGGITSVFNDYSIFRTISKQKDVTVNEFTGEIADIITVSLEQKPEWMVAQERMQESYDAAILDLGKTIGNVNIDDVEKEEKS